MAYLDDQKRGGSLGLQIERRKKESPFHRTVQFDCCYGSDWWRTLMTKKRGGGFRSSDRTA